MREFESVERRVDKNRIVALTGISPIHNTVVEINCQEAQMCCEASAKRMGVKQRLDVPILAPSLQRVTGLQR